MAEIEADLVVVGFGGADAAAAITAADLGATVVLSPTSIGSGPAGPSLIGKRDRFLK